VDLETLRREWEHQQRSKKNANTSATSTEARKDGEADGNAEGSSFNNEAPAERTSSAPVSVACSATPSWAGQLADWSSGCSDFSSTRDREIDVVGDDDDEVDEHDASAEVGDEGDDADSR